MTGPTSTPPTDEQRKRAGIIFALLRATLGDPTLIIPDNEYAAISLSVRQWILMLSTCEGALKILRELHPSVADDPMVQKGLAAFQELNRKFSEANTLAAARHAAEHGSTPAQGVA